MPKNTRRVTVTRTVTFTTTIDTPGRPEESDANMLILLGGAAGTTGTLSIAELLAAATLANNGTVSRANWSATGTSVNVEPYITRPASTALTVGRRVASVSPPSGYEAALGMLFVVTVAGTTASGTTEPNWTTTAGGTTTDGTVTYRAISKFTAPSTYAVGAQTLGAVVRPSASSMKEYLVTTAGTSSGTPTWTSSDSVGATIALPGAGALLCIAGCVTYANSTFYELGAVVKPSAGSSEEYLVTTAGVSDTTALTTSVGASVTRGTAVFKRIV